MSSKWFGKWREESTAEVEYLTLHNKFRATMTIQLTLRITCLILLTIQVYWPVHGYCGPSQLISKIIATGNEFRTECGRPYPICVYDCKWTNYTCNAIEKQQRWTKNTAVLSNVTKRGDNNIVRKCCKSSSMNVSTCHSVQWFSGNSFKARRSEAYSVQQFADAHCPSRSAVVRDIVSNKANIPALEICCFTYLEARMVCRSKDGAVVKDAALISTSLSISLALGIGVPLYFLDCRHQFTIRENVEMVCGPNSIEKAIVSTNAECCQICARMRDRTFCVYDTSVRKCYIRICSNGQFQFAVDGCISYIPK